MGYLGAALLVLLGGMMILNPQLLWKMEHFLSVKNGEPSDLYIALMRIGGIVLVICALLVLLYCIF